MNVTRSLAALVLVTSGALGCRHETSSSTGSGPAGPTFVEISGSVLVAAPLAPNAKVLGSTLQVGIFSPEVWLAADSPVPLGVATVDTSTCPGGACPFALAQLDVSNALSGLLVQVEVPFASPAETSVPTATLAASADEMAMAVESGRLDGITVYATSPAGLANLAAVAGQPPATLLADGALVALVRDSSGIPAAGVTGSVPDANFILAYANDSVTAAAPATGASGLLLLTPDSARSASTCLSLQSSNPGLALLRRPVVSTPTSLIVTSLVLPPAVSPAP